MKKFFITLFVIVVSLVTIYSAPSVANAAGGPPVEWTHNSDGSWTVKTVVVPWEIKEIGNSPQQIFCGHNHTPCTTTEYTFKVDGCPFVQVDYNDGIHNADDYFPGPTKEDCTWEPPSTTPPSNPPTTTPPTTEPPTTTIPTTPEGNTPTVPLTPGSPTSPTTIEPELAAPQTVVSTTDTPSTESNAGQSQRTLAATGNPINLGSVVWFFIGLIILILLFRFISRRI